MDAFFDAVRGGDVRTVQSLLHEHPSLASARSPEGISALLLARYRGHERVVDALRAAGPDLDVFDASALGDVRTLDILLDLDPLLVEAVAADGYTALHLAAHYGQLDAVYRLLQGGAAVDAVAANEGEVRPLHSAAAGGHVEVVAALLEAGADPNARQHGGFTALDAARQHGDTDMEQVLLAHGATSPDPGPT
jgi:ankyrin repeat protein